MMNNRVSRINEVLKDLYISVINNNITLTNGAVYHYLVDRSANNSKVINAVHNSMFDRWVDRFKNRSNIRVFVADNWKYFCQFTNDDKTVNGSLDYIKVYIPLDYNHVEEGANRIFDFLDKNNIKHHSKIATHVRADDVVVRLYRKEDAVRLQEFVSRDGYIREGMLDVNPFCFNKDGVGYAYDNMSSYNSYVSSLIADYINMVKEKGYAIGMINIDSFYNYVNNIGHDLVKMKSLLSKGRNNNIFLTDAYVMNDLLKLSLKSNDINDYYRFYDKARDVRYRTNMEREVDSNYKKQLTGKKTDATISSYGNDSNNLVVNKEELFKEFILTTMKKYPLGYDSNRPNMSGFDYIISYLNGNLNAVTRDNNLRDRLFTNLCREDIYDIVISSGIIGNNIGNKVNNYIKKVMLDDIIKSMIERMPGNYIRNLNGYLRDNDLRYITSNGMARELAMTMQASDMRRFMYDMGVFSIEEYKNKYYNKEDDRRMRR